MRYNVIIVNYNGCSDTLECLEALLKSTYQDFQVFVVDNSVKGEDFEIFKQWSVDKITDISTRFAEIVYPLCQKIKLGISFFDEDEIISKVDLNQKIIFIKANKNKGFSAANNIVLDYIREQNDYDYIWLLNNDTIVPLDFLYKMDCKLKNNDYQDGIFGNALCYYDNPEILQCIGNKCNNWLGHTFPVYEKVEYKEVLNSMKDKPLYHLSPIGASMFVKKRCFEEVGKLEEVYFLYFEEWDYTIRARKKGWRSVIFGDVFIYHKHSTTIDRGNKEGISKTLFSDYYLLRNKLIFARKNLSFFYLPTIYLSYLPVIINRIKRGQWSRLTMILKIILGIKLFDK